MERVQFQQEQVNIVNRLIFIILKLQFLDAPGAERFTRERDILPGEFHFQ